MGPKSIIAVVLNIENDHFYQLGTTIGKLTSLYTRNKFTLCTENFISVAEVGNEEVIVREVINKLSLVGGQGFKKCILFKKVHCK